MIDDGDLVIAIVRVVRIAVNIGEVGDAPVGIVRPGVVRQIPARRVLVIQSLQPSQSVIRERRVRDNLGSRQIVVPRDASEHASRVIGEIDTLRSHRVATGLAFLLHLREAIGVIISPGVLEVGRT